MEKVKIAGKIHHERYHYEWQFTDDEKNKIRRILMNKAPKEEIESFIYYLQGLCELEKTIIIDQPSRSKVRLTRERILTDCKAALGHLKQCEKGECVTWYDETIDPFWSHQPFQKKICPECKHPFTGLAWREKCVQCNPTAEAPHKKDEPGFLEQYLDSAWAAVGPLEKSIRIMEKYHKAEGKKIGRKKANSDNFIDKIRDIFIEHIGKPSTYENGPFYEIVQVDREILNLPYSDPSRAIKAALKNK